MIRLGFRASPVLRKMSLNNNNAAATVSPHSSYNRKVYVVGGKITPFIGKGHPDFISKGHPDFGKKNNPTLEEHLQAAVTGCIEETKVNPSLIEKAWIGNFAGELFSNQGHLGAAVVGALPELKYKPVMRVEAACASGGIAFASAVESIQAGSNVCLVVGAEVQTTVSPRQGGDYLARAAHYSRQRALDDFTFPALFAQRVKAYTQKYNVSLEDIARVSVKAYGNANKNALAHMKAVKMDLEGTKASDKNPAFLKNPELQPFIKTSDCSQVSDGAAAMIVVSEEGLKLLGKDKKDCIEVLAVSLATGNLYEDADFTVMDTTQAAAKRAFQQTGLTPNQVQIAEVHDCFAIAEILMYEAIGWANPGEGTKLVKEGATNINGRIPVNTGGGLIGFGHPVGATGIKQVLEVFRQMKGLCGEYQVPNIPSIGLTANMGGSDKTSVVSLFANTTNSDSPRSKY